MGKRSRTKNERIDAPRATTTTVASAGGPIWSDREWFIVALLVAINLLVFGQLASHLFLNYDDGQFIYENEAVMQGLSGSSIGWALTSLSIGWYPLTWLSHMLDVQLWSLHAAGHLLMQLALHALTTCILFLTMRRLTGSTLRSAFVAALFAIHPMHVESVAWASERKDTLSTLLVMLGLFAYARIRQGDRTHTLILTCVALLASLTAKQMYVTFPFLLLLLDFWPLERLDRIFRNIGALLLEKLPFFALAIFGSVMAIVGQRNLRAVQSVEALPLAARIANAAVAYVRYLGKLFWPFGLAVPYPLTPVATGATIGAVLLLVAISAAAIVFRNRIPYLAVGWFWFVGTLVPVIGLVQIGAQSMADRYSYFSYIGLFIVLVWGSYDLARRMAVSRQLLTGFGVAVVIVLSLIAWKQTSYWKSSETLFTHTIATTPPNFLAEYSLGQTLQRDDPDHAIPHLDRAIALVQQSLREHPGTPAPEWYAQSYVARGTALLMKSRTIAAGTARAQMIDDGAHQFEQALVIDPATPHAKKNLEVAAAMRLENERGAGLPASTPAASPQYDALMNEGTSLSRAGRYDDAVAQFRKATELAPTSAEAFVYLGLALVQAKRNGQAIEQLRHAKELDATKANGYITRALRLAPNDHNLDQLIQQLGAPGNP